MADIIFGIDALELTDPSQTCCQCGACGSNSLFVSIQSRWIQIMFVPLIPIGNLSEIRCLKCRSRFDYNNLNPVGKEYFRQQSILAKRRGGSYLRIGFILVLAFSVSVASLIISSSP